MIKACNVIQNNIEPIISVLPICEISEHSFFKKTVELVECNVDISKQHPQSPFVVAIFHTVVKSIFNINKLDVKNDINHVNEVNDQAA
tara:strand:- start:2992 stop:3255 length:264 start_codon:yes stop_codon:yes gene_type:complete